MWGKYLSLGIVEISYSEHVKEMQTMYYRCTWNVWNQEYGQMLEGKLLSIHAWNPLDFFLLL
jgi:hypothetical protein